MIGDPSGKDSTRKILDEENINNNIKKIKKIFEKLLDTKISDPSGKLTPIPKVNNGPPLKFGWYAEVVVGKSEEPVVPKINNSSALLTIILCGNSSFFPPK